MVWEPIPDEHTHRHTTQTHRQTEFYDIRLRTSSSMISSLSDILNFCARFSGWKPAIHDARTSLGSLVAAIDNTGP